MENSEIKKNSGQYIMIGDNRVRYFEEGEGETVLFIHGIGQAMYTFRKNVHALSQYCHVVTVDLLGHGLSDKPDIDYTIDDFSSMIYDFTQAMALENITLLGFSTGAVIALDVAQKHPELVKRLILLSPGGVTKTYPATVKFLTVPVISDIIFTFFSTKTVKKVLTQAYFDPTMVSRDLVRHYYKVLSNRENLDAAMTALANWNDEEIAYRMSEIKAPSYIFWGEEDTWHPLSMLDLYEDALPEVLSYTLADCGHILHEERSDEFNKKLIEIVSAGN